MVHDVFRGSNGFSYEVKDTEDSTIVDVRDAQDEYFARVEYIPEIEQYVVEVDAGYSTEEDLESVGILNKLQVENRAVPEIDNPFVRVEEDFMNERIMRYGVVEGKGRKLELEEMDDPDRKTLVRITSSDPEIASLARTMADTVSHPAVESEKGDPYKDAWMPHAGTDIVKNESESRSQTIQKVFDAALSLSEDILEPEQET